MAVWHVYRSLLCKAFVFVIVPNITLGLLSDYKICGDSDCESPMSRVQAIRDHHGRDCRFLSFRRGDIISVYHKLTGRREDLWAGTIDKKFGYFPKDAVEEEQIYATKEKVVETQRSDFFCVDEYGYPIDSTELDSDDDNDNKKIQIQDFDSTQTIPLADDASVKRPSLLADPLTEFPVSAQQADGTTAEGDGNKNAADAATGTHKEKHNNPSAVNEQGGSPSASWLGSTVTGWLGLGKKEESVDLPIKVKDDERKETQGKTSSLTGWLGFGREEKPDDTEDVKSRDEDKGMAVSLTSTMTGWLGFGKKTNNDQDGNIEMEKGNEEIKFRSRRMSLDLEGSQLDEEEKKELGTLDWLGSRVSHTLGFGVKTEETIKEEKKQSASSSWLGSVDIFGSSKDREDADVSRVSDLKDNTLQQETPETKNIDTTQTQREEEKNELDVQRTEEEHEFGTIPESGKDTSRISNKGADESNAEEQIETEAEYATLGLAENNSSDNTGASEGSKIGAVFTVDQKDISPLIEASGERSSSIDEDRSAEMESEEHPVPNAIENYTSSKSIGDEYKTAKETNIDVFTQSDIGLVPEFRSVELNSESPGQSVDTAETRQLESKAICCEGEELAEIPPEETGCGGGGHEGEAHAVGTDVLCTDISTTLTAEQGQGKGNTEGSSGISQAFLSAATAEERNDQHVTAADNSQTPAMIAHNSRETEAPEEESAAQVENSGDQKSVPPQRVTQGKGDASFRDMQKETDKYTGSNLQQAPSGPERVALTPSASVEAIGSEEETEVSQEGEGSNEKQDQSEAKQHVNQAGLKEVERRDDVEKVLDTKEKHQGKEENEKQQAVEEIQEERAQEAVMEVKEELQAVEGLKEEERLEKQEEDKELKTEQKGNNDNVEKFKVDKKQEVTEELEEEEIQVKVEVLEAKERQQEVKEGKQDEVVELKEKKEHEDSKEVEEIKDETEEIKEIAIHENIKDEENPGNMEVLNGEAQQEEGNTEEEEKRRGMEEINENEKQDEVKEQEKDREKLEVNGENKQEEMEKRGGRRERQGEGDGSKQNEVLEFTEDKQENVEVATLLTNEKRKEMEEKDIKEGEKREERGVEELEEVEKQEMGEFVAKEEKRQEEVEELMEKEKQEIEMEKPKGGKQEEVEEIKGEETQKELGEVKEKEKQGVGEELKEEEEKEENMQELESEKRLEEKDEKKQDEEVLKEEGKGEEEKEEKKQEDEEEVKEDMKQEDEQVLKEEKKQENEEVLKEEGKGEEKKQEDEEEVKEDMKQVDEQVLKEEKKQEEGELKGEKNQDDEQELKEEGKGEEVEEKKQEDEEEVKKKKQDEEEVKEEKKQDDEQVFTEEGKGEEVEEKQQEDEGVLKEEKKQEDEEKLKEEELHEETGQEEVEQKEEVQKMQQELKEIQEEGKQEEVESQQEKVEEMEERQEMDEAKEKETRQELKVEEEENGSSSADEERVQREQPNHHMGEGGVVTDRREDTDLPFPAGHSSADSRGQTDENRDDGQLHPGDAPLSDLSDDKVFYGGNNTESEQSHSHHKTDVDVYGNESPDSQMTETIESQAVISQHKDSPGPSPLSDDLHTKSAEAESGKAFGLFQNIFSFYTQTPAAETKDSVDSGRSSHANVRELDSDSDSDQLYMQDLHADSPDTMATEQSLHSPSPVRIQTSTPPHTPPPQTETPLQTKTPSKLYKSLASHIGEDEEAVLIELFGQHKLQFLDYMLGSSETGPDCESDTDESILSDIERLLQYHRETLAAPSGTVTDAPQDDKEKTTTLSALLKLEMLITRVRESFSPIESDTRGNYQAEASCVSAPCSTHSKGGEMNTEEDLNKAQDPPTQEAERMDVKTDEHGGRKERETADEKRGESDEGCGAESVPPASHTHDGLGSPLPLEGVMEQILHTVHLIAEESATHIHTVRELLIWTVEVVSSLPDDIRPGPDLYGVPWEPAIITCLIGLVTLLLFMCRCYSSVKSRMYRSKEQWMATQVEQLLEEKCKVLESLSKCQQEYDELEDSLRDSGVLAQTEKTEQLEVKARQLAHTKTEHERDLKQLKDQLDQQKEHRIEQERRIAVLEESMKTTEDETKDFQSQEEQAQTTMKVYAMNSDRLQRNLEAAREENTLLQESNTHLKQQLEEWAERVSELEVEMQRCEATYSRMQQDVANKDERILSLTDCLLRMKAWDSDLEEEEGEEGARKKTSNRAPGKEQENGSGDGKGTDGHFQKVQKLIYAAKLNADLKAVDEDKDRVFAKLNDEVKAKEDLQEGIQELEKERLSLQSDAEHYSDQVQRLQQKLQIMTEMYQENELKLHRLLTVEEKERLQKEEKLNKADKNIALAMEELNNYRQRAEEMEEELEKTKQSYQTQISAHEKKAHNNWLAARGAERDLSDIRRENALLRQKLTDTQFKLDSLDKDPFVLDTLARPLPFRGERSPYGPSPLGRPASETRPFLSPPTLMDGPPARLSPRVSRGPMEPPGGQGEVERSGGPHSDSGSNSPTWERERRRPLPGPPGPLGPPGYMFPEPGGPMYRRPPPPPGALGLLPPPGSLPPGPPPPHLRGFPPAGPLGPLHPADMADGTYREHSHGPGELEHRESGPGDGRTPHEADPRMGGPAPPGAPLVPIDGSFPRRPPYGPPPPDLYPPRGPEGPLMIPRWATPLPGMMFPSRFPPGGPPFPPGPHPHHAPLMRPPLLDSLPPSSMAPTPPQPSFPAPPHSQSPEEHRPSPEDAI